MTNALFSTILTAAFRMGMCGMFAVMMGQSFLWGVGAYMILRTAMIAERVDGR